jgi:CHAP domain
MNRASGILGVAALLALPTLVLSASTEVLPIKVVSFSAPAPTAGKNALNAKKSTASFKIGKETNYRTLVAYGNGTSASMATNPRQCVELTKRYAASLGFVKFVGGVNSKDLFTGSAVLGNGHQVARNFAKASNGGFSFVANGAAALPKPGAVVSIDTWKDAAGAYGHVGIVLNYTKPKSTATSVSVEIFEQNMPIDNWKTVTFTKVNGKWYGTMRNKTFTPSVVGWANPAG